MAEIIDKDAVRSMVEEYWRSFVAVARTNPQVGRKSIADFQKRIELMAGLMDASHAKTFLETVEEIREALFKEYMANPDAQKRRLGLPTDKDQTGRYRREGMGEMVVKTAVRATIWEAIFALFRLSP